MNKSIKLTKTWKVCSMTYSECEVAFMNRESGKNLQCFAPQIFTENDHIRIVSTPGWVSDNKTESSWYESWDLLLIEEMIPSEL